MDKTQINGSAPSLKSILANILMEMGKPVSSKEVKSVVIEKGRQVTESSISSMLHQMSMAKILNKTIEEDGIKYSVNCNTPKFEEISISSGKKKKKEFEVIKQVESEKPKTSAKKKGVSINVNGIEMSVEEAMDIYIQLQTIFK